MLADPPDHRIGHAAGLPMVREWRVTCSPLVGDALSYAEWLSRDSGPVPRARTGAFEEGTAAMADGSTDRTTRGPGSGRTGLGGEKVTTGAFPSPLRHFLAQLDQLRSAGILDMDQVGRLLVELAADEEISVC
jgi:hypothetical protein